VHVISKSAWRTVVAADPALELSISAWHKIATAASWSSIVEVRNAYPHTDFVDPYTVFNIKGNTYRLIVKIEYKWQTIFVKHLLTHEEYDQGGWK
jgi:mRNA interferase HigB